MDVSPTRIRISIFGRIFQPHLIFPEVFPRLLQVLKSNSHLPPALSAGWGKTWLGTMRVGRMREGKHGLPGTSIISTHKSTNWRVVTLNHVFFFFPGWGEDGGGEISRVWKFQGLNLASLELAQIRWAGWWWDGECGMVDSSAVSKWLIFFFTFFLPKIKGSIVSPHHTLCWSKMAWKAHILHEKVLSTEPIKQSRLRNPQSHWGVGKIIEAETSPCVKTPEGKMVWSSPWSMVNRTPAILPESGIWIRLGHLRGGILRRKHLQWKASRGASSKAARRSGRAGEMVTSMISSWFRTMFCCVWDHMCKAQQTR